MAVAVLGMCRFQPAHRATRFLVSAMGSPHKGAARAVPLSDQRHGSVLFCAFSPMNPKSWCGFVCSEISRFIVA